LHFPFACIFYAWVTTNNIPLSQGLSVGLVLLASMLVLAYAALKFYDEPIRKWLAKKYIGSSKKYIR
jgi:peptidoglycan/LPS O-acetylase OafA/YrhL